MQGHLIAVVSGYTFEAFKRDGSCFVEGSSRSWADGSGTSRRLSRAVVEVDVHGSSWEVVVHGVVEVVVHVATVVVQGLAGRRVAVHVRRGTRCSRTYPVDVQGRREELVETRVSVVGRGTW